VFSGDGAFAVPQFLSNVVEIPQASSAVTPFSRSEPTKIQFQSVEDEVSDHRKKQNDVPKQDDLDEEEEDLLYDEAGDEYVYDDDYY
jgi:hypothetical protein